MIKGLYTAYTGMLNEQHRMDVMTNNLANVTTTGFKKEGTTSQAFSDILAYRIKDNSVGLQLANRIGVNNPGVKIGEDYVDYTEGSFRITDNTYDLALAGDGFFAIEFTNKAGETSTKYTRAGHFTLNREGYLVTEEGDYVLDTRNNRIRIDTLQETAIERDGSIIQDGRTVAQIGVFDFADYNYLDRYGETYFEPLPGAEPAPADAEIYSGYLEMSNVSSVQEMVNLIAITRQYESNQKVIQTLDTTLEQAVQLGRIG